MHFSVYQFFINFVDMQDIYGKDVLEIGSYDVNGSVRPIIEKTMDPKSYVGTDMRPGPMVDVVISAESLLTKYDPNSFDFIVCTEMLEHAEHWQTVITNIKTLLRPGGCVMLTTRSKGFGLHDYPADYWRFEPDDMMDIFKDFERLDVAADAQFPGVFVKAYKPHNWINKVPTIKPFSMRG